MRIKPNKKRKTQRSLWWCHFWISLPVAALFLMLMLVVSNWHTPLGTEKATLQWFDWFSHNVFGPKPPSAIADSIMLVDVHYDKRFVVERDAEGFPKGRLPVTDHDKLYRLLSYLEQQDYRYILLDIFFDKAISEPQDSSLYSLIVHMPRLGIALPPDSLEIADEQLKTKAGVTAYSTALWENDFVKYRFLFDDSLKSLPLKMYEELNDRTIEPGRFIATDGNAWARTSTFLTFELINDNDNKRYMHYNLGDVVGDSLDGVVYESKLNSENFPVNGKYILIGDFKDDRHITFRGSMSGTFINFNAYLTLLRGYHRLSFWLLLILGVAFWALVFLTIHHTSFSRVFMWLGYPFYFTVLCLFSYLLFREVYDVFAATILFYSLETIVQCLENKDKIKEKIKTTYIMIKSHKRKTAFGVFIVLLIFLILFIGVGKARAQDYKIMYLSTSHIEIGGKRLKKGNVYKHHEPVKWTKSDQWLIVQRVGTDSLFWCTRKEFSYRNDLKVMDNTIIHKEPLGSRNANEIIDQHYSALQYFLADTLFLPAYTKQSDDIITEAVWMNKNREVVVPVSRTTDGMYYVLTKSIFGRYKPRDLELQLRERSLDGTWVNVPYNSLKILYLR